MEYINIQGVKFEEVEVVEITDSFDYTMDVEV